MHFLEDRFVCLFSFFLSTKSKDKFKNKKPDHICKSLRIVLNQFNL